MSKTTKTTSSKHLETGNQAKSISAAFSPKSLLNLFLERWWVGLIAAVIGVALFIVAQPELVPVYYSEVKVIFEARKDKVLNIQEVVETTATSSNELYLHLEQIMSTSFYEYVQSSFTPKEIELIQNAYRDPNNPSSQPPSLAAIIRPNLEVRVEGKTTLVKIGCTNRDPEAAALIANRYARKYIDYNIDKVMTGTNSAIVLLKNQSDEKRKEVEAAERALQAYRAKHDLAAMGEKNNIILDKINSLSNAIVETQIEQTNLRTLIDMVEDFTKTGKNVFELSSISSFGSVAALKEELETLKAVRQQLAENYLDEHPRMKENALALENIQRRLEENIKLAQAELKTRYSVAVQHEIRIRKEMGDAEGLARELDRISIDYRFLEQDVATHRSAYNMINERLNEANIVNQLSNVNIKILDRAPLPSSPSNLTPKQVAAQATALAIILLFGLPLGLGFIDTRIKTSGDVENTLNQVLLGGVKTMKKLSENERPNVFRLGKDEALSEAYRGIFSEIEIRSLVPFPKRLLITSSVPSEGKSLTASNLAAVFAAHGRKTLLVDCDFRRPTLRRYFGTPSGSGLLPWLREHSQIPNVQIDPSKMGVVNIGPKLDLLPAGDAIKNPTEIIDQIAACDLFNKLSQHYDLVMLDTPPSIVFPDALLLSRFCSEMIYVCRFKTVRKSIVKKTLGKFTESGINILGVVLNCMPTSSIMNYNYEGYGAYNASYYKSYQTEKA